ncbi:MAG TPA: hypothetical protein VE954_07085 [Oligoflexus sp.]|uniref:hypothetical protein n=1 Tax=Oligoflexus sp. TaxID=1971216 RepID=UPI002D2618EB|nr:hypothetical protein [Oligoflexus sp.]HYX32861.1 hypothetical protein [Oligoflexus sp.]
MTQPPLDLDWTFIYGGSTNYRSHDLTEVDAHRLEFRPSTQPTLFGWLVVLLSGAYLLYFIRTPAQHKAAIGVCLALMIVGIFAFLLSEVHVFDRHQGFYSGRRQAQAAKPLDQILAVQVLYGTARSFRVAQMNLCLKDRTRRLIICHADRNALYKEAQRLAVFLNVPFVTVDR